MSQGFGWRESNGCKFPQSGALGEQQIACFCESARFGVPRAVAAKGATES